MDDKENELDVAKTVEFPDEELIAQIRREIRDEEFKPAAVRELFDMEGDLTLKTETPSRMILPLVRMRVLEAAANPSRKESLVEVFIREMDRRMISKDRKGRLELLAALQALAASEEEGEEAAI